MSKVTSSTEKPTSSKSLRFAALIRVSTEQQEKHGESLRTQRALNERDVNRLGGVIVEWYGGAEHATPGWEKKELDRLLADATRNKFDAVIVAYQDRWSRDNAKSKQGLEVFRTAGIRFFVGSMEMDLFDPQHIFILGMSAEVGEFIARQQSKKSMENRIERAKRGCPTCGKLPFGRTFDKETEKWGIDPKKQEVITDIAKRIIAGESLNKMAAEYRLSHSNICKTLHHHCGDTWEQEFRADTLNIHEVVTTRVPRLLPEATIKSVRQRLVANRSRVRSGGKLVHEYPLSGCIFCAVCGHAMSGQVNGRGKRYYRHGKNGGAGECPLRPRPWVPADQIERKVVRDLFDMFGNPAAIERAVRAAVPDCDETLKRQKRLTEELHKIGKGRDRLLDLVVKGTLTDSQAEKKLRELKLQEDSLGAELDTVTSVLAALPKPDQVKCYVEEFKDSLGGTTIVVYDDHGEMVQGGTDVQTFISMNSQDKRALVAAMFHEPMPDGKPAGVYVAVTGSGTRTGGFEYTLQGRLAWRASSQKGALKSAGVLCARQ